MDDLIKLSRVTRSRYKYGKVDLRSWLGKSSRDLAKYEPKRKVKVTIAPNMTANGDKNLAGFSTAEFIGQCLEIQQQDTQNHE